MQINSAQFGRGSGLTVTESARRAQIVEATIETLAELGYAKTSFARIVERAGLSSTRMISYHFGTREELMMATLGAVIDAYDTFQAERVPEGADRAALLRGQLEADVEFLAGNPHAAKALAEIGRHADTGEGAPTFELVSRDFRVGRVERQLRQGQREGVFGEFDAAVLATMIRDALDGVALRLGREPTADVVAYGRELARIFDRVTGPDRGVPD